ncbi:MAG: hypothetical protein ACI88H_002602 [Cocleimonas sp.]|jgi:hypothetical protein
MNAKVVKKQKMTLGKAKPKDISDEVIEAFGGNTVSEKNKAETKAVRKKMVKTAKAQVVRDSFTMPEDDYALIEKTKSRLMKSGVLLNKAEILRAGLHALNHMSSKDLLAISDGVEKIKTGRPKE